MDSGYISSAADMLCETALQAFFYIRLINGKPKLVCMLVFLTMAAAIFFAPVSPVCRRLLLMMAFILLGSGASVEKSGRPVFFAVFCAGVMSLCFGICNSLFSAVIACAGGIKTTSGGLAAMFSSEVISLSLFCLVCGTVCRRLKKHCSRELRFKRSLILLIPLTLIFLICGNIETSFYSAVDTSVHAVSHIKAATVLAFVFAGVFCILHTYAQMCSRSRLRERLSFCEQRAAFLKRYLNEAEELYNSAKSFRHDIKNHFSVLSGLMENGDHAAARSYLSQMNVYAQNLSFRFHTGSRTVDILLENKLSGLPEGIDVKCSLAVPKMIGISEFDMCTILSNALDNAVKGCMALKTGRYIEVSSAAMGDFYMISIENSFDGKPFAGGTGMYNIRRTAEKYGATVKINTKGRVFSLKVVLCISRQ